MTIPQWSTKKTPVICVNVIQETHNVKTFQFRANSPQLFTFKAGQFIGIQLEINGERHNRSYTIASSPSRPHLLELTIKKEQGGAVSPWLHENILVGSELEVRGPAGRFNNLDIESDKVLLISAGSGITPMMSMARFWSDVEPSKDVRFLNWVRSVEDIIFRRELSLLDFKTPAFELDVICTQPGLSENWLGRRGRINTTVLKDMVDDINDREIFCCGPEGFMEQVKICLEALDFDISHYHDESFDPGGKKKAKLAEVKGGSAQNSPQTNPNEPIRNIYQVKLIKSGQQFEIRSDEILLDKLEAQGVLIDTGCRAGNCGACRVHKISGRTETQNETGLLREDRQRGDILTCTTHVKSDIELEL